MFIIILNLEPVPKQCDQLGFLNNTDCICNIIVSCCIAIEFSKRSTIASHHLHAFVEYTEPLLIEDSYKFVRGYM